MENLALADVRVLDLTRLLPGGLCTLVLADLGADVIKVEAPPIGDYARNREPHIGTAEPSTSSASFRGLNRNKRSVLLDLKAPRGPEALLALAQEADVVVESFRPGVMDRLGVGYAELSAANPGIVLCSISGWGQCGSFAQMAGHDLNYLAATGLLSFTGSPEEVPVVPPLQVADCSAGLFAVISILAALNERRSSGKGQQIDVSLAHSALPFAAMTIAGVLATGKAKARMEGIWDGGVVCYQVYRCVDGWIALAALEEKFWANLCQGLERDDLLGHRYAATTSATHAEMVKIMASRTRNEWSDFGAAHDCCLTPVVGLPAALASPLLRDRGVVQAISQHVNEPSYEALTLPFELSRTPADVNRRPVPRLGADSREILSRSGLSLTVIEDLLTEGAG